MNRSPIKQLDNAIADDLGLALSPITMVLKHAKRFTTLVEGFAFGYTEGETVCYDLVQCWTEVNGMRHRNPRFRSNAVIEDRLNKRLYRRWYVWGNGFLYPVQTAKVDDLHDNFYFLIDDDPRHYTVHVFSEDTPFIRKKPLQHLVCRHPGWGVKIQHRERLCATA